MTGPEPAADARLLVIGDLERLGPIVRQCFAPHPIIGVRGYLPGLAELPRAPTRAVLVGHDPGCRKPDAALAAIRQVAGGVPIVYCCDPAAEPTARRLLSYGASNYVIFPPDAAELERLLNIPTRRTRERWIEAPTIAPVPAVEELARLADILPRLTVGDIHGMDAMAALICTALDAEHATVVLDGRTGQAGRGTPDLQDCALTESIREGSRPLGQIRVGRSHRGAFTHDDTAKLRHYAVLFGRMLLGARRAEEWRKLAMTDDLTGLPNRRRLMEFLADKLPEALQTRSTVTALYFDIDDFKRYNDRYGHEAGDEILRDVGQLFLKCCRETDIVARYGGDEFVVVFYDAEGPRMVGSRHPEDVIAVVKRFREALGKHTFARLGPEASGRLTISGGIAHFPWDASNAEDLIQSADRGLLQAKAAGKNRFWLIGDGDIVE